METRPDEYVPAAGHDWLLPFYDPVCRFVLRERRFKQRLVEQTAPPDAGRVLDLGCGTATLTLMLQQRYPSAEIRGVDGDPKVLEIARRKVAAAGVRLELDRGLAYDLAYNDACFDRVVSSLVFHHLTPEHKRAAFREVKRILKPGGSLHVVDFGPPRSGIARFGARIFIRDQSLRDNFEGRLPEMMRGAGFAEVEECGRHVFFGGGLSFYRAC